MPSLTKQGRKRTIYIDDETWNELLLIAAERSIVETHHVSCAELIRRGTLREVVAHYVPEWYSRPPTIGKIKKVYGGGRKKLLGY